MNISDLNIISINHFIKVNHQKDSMERQKILESIDQLTHIVCQNQIINRFQIRDTNKIDEIKIEFDNAKRHLIEKIMFINDPLNSDSISKFFRSEFDKIKIKITRDLKILL